MRFRLGLVIGFGTGYYLGSMAGRERYEQINAAINRIKRSESFELASEKAREVVDTGVERAGDLIDAARDDGDDPSGAIDPYLRSSPSSS